MRGGRRSCQPNGAKNAAISARVNVLSGEKVVAEVPVVISLSDDVFHFVNWILLVAAFLAWRFRRTDSLRDARLLGTGFGALAIVAWEIAEWIAGELGAGEALGLTYGDTVGDLALSTTGGFIAAIISVRLFGARHTA